MENKMYSYEDMKNMTIEFYNSIGIKDLKDRIDEAVISLTMPQYKQVFNDDKNNRNNGIKIKNDHRALSTVGDAICEAYWMKEKYNISSTQETLTNEKDVLMNEHLSIIGKELLEGKLFYANNDLDDSNTKSYATAFEAVVGFISLIDINKAFKFLSNMIN